MQTLKHLSTQEMMLWQTRKEPKFCLFFMLLRHLWETLKLKFVYVPVGNNLVGAHYGASDAFSSLWWVALLQWPALCQSKHIFSGFQSAVSLKLFFMSHDYSIKLIQRFIVPLTLCCCFIFLLSMGTLKNKA